MLLIHAKKLSFSFYGYGFLWTCGFLFFFLSQSDSSAEFVAVKDFLYLGSILCTSLVVIAWYGKPAKGFPRIKAAKIGSVLLCMGALLASAANLLGDEATVVGAASRVLAGAGQSLSWVAWAEVLSRREVEEVEYAFLSWLPMLIVMFLAVVVLKLVFVVSPALLYCLIALLPVGSFLCFRALASEVSDSAALADRSESKGERIGKLGSRGSGFGASGSAGFDEGWTKRQCSQVMRMFISLGCIFVIISFVWNAFLSQGFQEFELLIVAFLGAAFSALAITWYSLRTTSRFGLPTLYRWALPVMVLGIALSIFPGTYSMFSAYLCLAATNIAFDLMAKLFFVHTAQRLPHWSLVIASIGFAIEAVGGMAGPFLWQITQYYFGQLEYTAIMITALVVFVFIVSASLDGRFMVEAPLSTEFDDRMAGNKSERVDDSAALADKCKLACERYGLSAREQDVLLLLIQGRSRTYIREELYISKGTVDTHIHHIYTKVGVRSKDELMKLVLDDTMDDGYQ